MKSRSPSTHERYRERIIARMFDDLGIMVRYEISQNEKRWYKAEDIPPCVKIAETFPLLPSWLHAVLGPDSLVYIV